MSSHALPFALRRRRALLGPLAALGVLCASGLAVERYLASARAVEATQESCTEQEEPCEPRLPELERLTWLQGTDRLEAATWTPLDGGAAVPSPCGAVSECDRPDGSGDAEAEGPACRTSGDWTSGDGDVDRCVVRCAQRELDERG